MFFRVVPAVISSLVIYAAYCYGTSETASKEGPSIALPGEKDQNIERIKDLMQKAGISIEGIQSISFNDRSLSTTYKLTDRFGTVSWLKFSNKPGSNGAYRLKFLEACDFETLEHGKERRELLRSMISWINQASSRELLPEPISINARGEFEYRVPQGSCLNGLSHLDQTLMTLWKNVNGEHFKCENPPYVWTIHFYSPESIREMAKTLFEIQTLAEKWLSSQANRQEIERVLSHENGSLTPYDEIVAQLLTALGLDGFPLSKITQEIDTPKSSLYQALQSNALKKKQQIHIDLQNLLKELSYDPLLSLDEATELFVNHQNPSWESFLLKGEKHSSWETLFHKKDQDPSKRAVLAQALFRAERENGWDRKTLSTGRRLLQLQLANEVVSDILDNNATTVHNLLTKLLELSPYYGKISQFPKGLLHQNAHPHQYLSQDGKAVILDVLDSSYGVAFADLSNEYVYKLSDSYKKGKLPLEKTIEYLRAALIPEWIQDHGPDLFAYNIASFWSFSKNIPLFLGLSEKDAEQINLAFSLEIFLLELDARKELEKTYREELFPMVGTQETDALKSP